MNESNYHDYPATFTEAVKLARKGRYKEAENLLEGFSEESPLISFILDLKAKICAQQGKYSEAEQYWKEALVRSPDNPTYRKAIDCIHKNNRLRVTPQMVLIVIAIGILCFFFFWLIESRMNSVLSQQSKTETNLIRAIGDIQTAQQKISNIFGETDTRLKALEKSENEIPNKDVFEKINAVNDKIDVGLQKISENSFAMFGSQSDAVNQVKMELMDLKNEIEELVTQTILNGTNSVNAALNQNWFQNNISQKIDNLQEKIDSIEKYLTELNKMVPFYYLWNVGESNGVK